MIMMFDPLYLLLVLVPGLLLSLGASIYVKSTFARYSQVMTRRGYTGAEAAAVMLDRAGVNRVRIERTRGLLGDHYDPAGRTLRLSPEVYDRRSLAAVGVACHEAGHALQHAGNYPFLSFRTALVPMTYVGSNLSYFFVMLGLLLRLPAMFMLGAVVFSVAVLFSFVTLPVEWNASTRAKQAMITCGLLYPQEKEAAGRVLNAAFLTYAAAAVTSLLTLLYYLMRAGVLGGRR